MVSRIPLILAIDDDPGLLHLVKRVMELAGYRAVTASNGEQGLEIAHEENPALILLDIMLPGLDGFQVCQRLRQGLDTPIIMVTVKDGQDNIVRGLEMGADDYITKPFSTNELVARVKAVLRRARFPDEMPRPPLTISDLTIDFSQHRVTRQGQEIALTPTEYRLLATLAQSEGRVFTQNDLLARVWGREYRGESHLLQVAIARLRQKMEDDPHFPKYILTRVGIGYTFRKV